MLGSYNSNNSVVWTSAASYILKLLSIDRTTVLYIPDGVGGAGVDGGGGVTNIKKI